MNETHVIFGPLDWIPISELELFKQQEAIRKFEEGHALWHGIFPLSVPENNLKWAWIKVNGERKMCWVDNKTNRAFEAKDYGQTDIEIKEFIFERWCTSFDL